MKRYFTFVLLFISYFTFSQNVNPDYSEEFIQDYLSSIEVTMNEDDYNWMVNPDNIWSDTYQHATVVYKGSNNTEINYLDLGIRLRGNTSRGKDKKSFKLNFKKFTDDQRFFGLKKLNLKANVNDPSCVREHMVMNLYRDYNLVVARVNQVKLYINDNYMGLYSNVEQIDKTFLGSRYNDNDGNLYKCTYPADLSDLNKVYDDSVYELKTNESENNRDNLYAFIDFLTTATDSDFDLHIDEYIDVTEYLKQLPVEILSGHWDGYSYNKNNFYLYYNPEESRFEYIPYDTDNTLGIDWVNRDWSDRNIYDWAKHGEPRPLHKRILAISRYYTEFSQNIDALLENIFTTTYQMDLANNYKALIQESVYADPYYSQDFGYTDQTFNDSYTINNVASHVKYGIQPFIEKRAETALEQLDQAVLTVTDNTFSEGIKFYPNPIDDNRVLYFSINNSLDKNIEISLYNIVGQKVFQESLTTNQNKVKVSLENIPSGIYILKSNSLSNQNLIKSSKIIIQ